jgi:hypothetical protein
VIEFEIGMRWTDLWRLAWRPWVPVAFAGMLRPEAGGAGGAGGGFVHTRFGVRRGGPVVVQRWRSAEALDAWARRDRAHAQPWGRFRRDEARRTADWGIWHRVRPV